MTKKMSRVMAMATLRNGFPFDSGDFSDEGVPLVRIRDLLSNDFETFVPRGSCPANAVVKDNQLVIGMDGDFNCVLWNRGEAALNQRLCVLEAKDGTDIRFLRYVLPKALKEINDVTYSTTVKHLSSDQVLNIRLPHFSAETQRSIADYLDRETGEIDAMLAKLEGLVGLLEERKQTEFHATAADSQRCHLGAVAELVTGTTPKDLESKKTDQGSGIPWIKPGDLEDGAIASTHLKNVVRSEMQVIPPHATLVCGIGTVGKVGYTGAECTVNQQITAAIPFGEVIPRFLFLAINSITSEMRATAGGTTMPIINNSRLAQYEIPLPPLDEQERIVTHLDDTTAQIDRMIAKAHQLRDLLTERRSVLITVAVTGQVEIG